MARRLLGTGITNSNGVATLDTAPDGTTLTHSYTGVGAGKIDVVAESGSLQSETYELLDAIFVDNGVSTDYNDTGWTNSNLVSPLDRTDGTKLEQSNTANAGFRFRILSQTTDICIEFDFKVVNASDGIFSFRNGSTSLKTIYASNVGAEANTWTHLKVTVKDGKYYLNTSTSGTALSEWNRFNFQSYNGNSIKYKNFVIYPI